VSRVERDLVRDLVTGIPPPLGREETEAPGEPREVQDHMAERATEQRGMELGPHGAVGSKLSVGRVGRVHDNCYCGRRAHSRTQISQSYPSKTKRLFRMIRI
jgi:hypothetical protein